MTEREEPWPWLPPGPGRLGRGGAPSRCPTWWRAALLAQRVVLLHGPLDDLSVTRVAAELMTLDAEGDEPVTLRVDCGEAALAPGADADGRDRADGRAGPGAVPRAGGWRRRRRGGRLRPPFRLAEHALLAVRAGDPAAGPRRATWPSGPSCAPAERERFCARVAAATGQAPATVEQDLERGRFLGADEALGYGILDEVGRPDAPVRQLPGTGPPPMGFRPLR